MYTHKHGAQDAPRASTASFHITACCMFIIGMCDALDMDADDVELGDSYYINLVRVSLSGPIRHDMHRGALDFNIFTIERIDANEEGLRTGIAWSGLPDFYMSLAESQMWKSGHAVFYEAPTVTTSLSGTSSLTPDMFSEIRGKVDTKSSWESVRNCTLFPISTRFLSRNRPKPLIMNYDHGSIAEG